MHWNDIEEIVINLEESYEEEEIPEYNLPYLKEMVLSLPNFEDHEVEVSDTIMKQILEHWLEVRG